MTRKRWTFEELARGEFLVSPPGATVRRAVDIMKRAQAPEEGWAAWCVRLVFDSLAQPVPVGLRDRGSGKRRILLELAPDAGNGSRQLDLELDDHGGRLNVVGQLMPPVEGCTVRVRGGSARRAQRLSPGGSFTLTGLKLDAGPVVLVLGQKELGDLEVPLPLTRGDLSEGETP